MRLSFLLVLAATTALAGDVKLPVRDDACVKDQDCAYDWTYLVDGQCCNGTCSPEPASKKHVEAVEQVCKRVGFTELCPQKKCVKLPELKCVANHCTRAK
jgi:hypothetical protein